MREWSNNRFLFTSSSSNFSQKKKKFYPLRDETLRRCVTVGSRDWMYTQSRDVMLYRSICVNVPSSSTMYIRSVCVIWPVNYYTQTAWTFWPLKKNILKFRKRKLVLFRHRWWESNLQKKNFSAKKRNVIVIDDKSVVIFFFLLLLLLSDV